MNNPLRILAGVIVCSVTLPIFLSVVSYDDIETNTPQKQEQLIEKKSSSKYINYETVDKDSPKINIYNHKTGKTQQMDIEEYLYGVLSGEMPSDFNIEALKAQAVAARTYVMYNQENETSKHKGAAVCTDYTHCQEYKSYEELKKSKGEDWIKNSYPKVKQAVNETKGHIITYNGEPILPLYFSTSSGKTENSEEVFSTEYPYLRSVDSPYDKYAPKYASTLKISNKDYVTKIKSTYSDININQNNDLHENDSISIFNDSIELSYLPDKVSYLPDNFNVNYSSQIKILNRSDGGSVEKIKLGNKELTGRDIRNILNLNSANFEIKFDTNSLDFVVKGYGHGVGMSQWGANGMAEEGYKYYEILSHYYKDTTIKDFY